MFRDKSSEVIINRVSGILIVKNKILLQKPEIEDFWVLPGGGINPFETLEQAIKREFVEEMCLKVKVDRFVFILENFFEYSNENIHSLEFYFLVSLLDSTIKLDLNEFNGLEEHFQPEKYGKIRLACRWFYLKELENINLKPKILKKILQDIPKHPKILINKD